MDNSHMLSIIEQIQKSKKQESLVKRSRENEAACNAVDPNDLDDRRNEVQNESDNSDQNKEHLS